MPGAFNLEKQLVFYGAYHSNKVNVRIHMVCVPIIMWTALVMISSFPTPSWMPDYTHVFNDHLVFKLNWASVLSVLYVAYYTVLFAPAALMYAPQQIFFVLTANSIAHDPKNIQLALYLHVAAWVAQFYGHGVHEGRAPALLDNIVGALFLAPFFVHLEMLFEMGYFPRLHKTVQNGVGVEIAKFRKEKAAEERSKKEL
ncbi:DUF962-domain-containing protein [Schizopora paradoxa]|uniref:DUF962-domain-containing protein n=1 Tax=Schizopora paradoxa TaxID=27342 RepID=A0A0H2SF91_9AGAM|nr:DUF962-domain-containing protein [Schizopora paradoxa]